MPTSTVPNLGASGAIAGVMGAFLITYPRDEIRTLLFLGWFIDVTVLPAALLIGLWFVIQLFSQIGSVANVQAGGVAYMAHVGGFIFGAIASRLFESRSGLRRNETGQSLSFRVPILRDESLLVFVLWEERFFASLRMTGPVFVAWERHPPEWRLRAANQEIGVPRGLCRAAPAWFFL